MTREHKLALIVGFSLVLVVGVLISDYFSKAHAAQLSTDMTEGTATKFGAGSGGLVTPGSHVTPPTAAAFGNPPPAPVTMTKAPPQLAGAGNGGTGMGAPTAALPLTQPPLVAPPPVATSPAPTDVVMGGPRGHEVPKELRETFDPVGPAGRGGAGAPGLARTSPDSLDRTTPPDMAPKMDSRRVSTEPMAKHQVKEGDSAYRIAQETYGDGRLWTKLREFNKGKMSEDGSLRDGVTLSLPPKEVLTGEAVMGDATRTGTTIKPNTLKPGTMTPTPSGPAASPTPGKPVPTPTGRPVPTTTAGTYTVQKGDILAEVAKKTLGSAKRWPELAELNKDVLPDPDALTAGMKLKLPPTSR